MKPYHKAQQDPGEIDAFIRVIKNERMRSYLEIGAKNGGSLWRVAHAMPQGSRVVAVDLPWGDRSTLASLRECCEELTRDGYDATLIIGDSTDPAIIASAAELGPYDIGLIDANHTEAYVRKDYENYAPMCNVIAFHDIGWRARPVPGKMPIEVPIVWEELKRGRNHTEIKFCPRDNGIGILWPS